MYHKDKMTIIKEMKEREKQCRVYLKISFVLEPTRFQAITRLGIPKGMSQAPTQEIWDFLQENEKKKEPIEWEYTENDDAIKFRFREWNIIHFNQSIEIPLASPEWEKSLTQDQILDSEIFNIIQKAIDSDPDLHQDSKHLLEEMKNIVSTLMTPERTTTPLKNSNLFSSHTRRQIVLPKWPTPRAL